MGVNVEKMENSTAKITFEATAEQLDEAILKVYNKNKKSFNIPGFRKGKVPFKMVEKMYGIEIFYEEAANELVGEAYAAAVKESGLDVVAQPDLELKEIEKGKPVVFEAVVTVRPEIKLGKYKGVEVEAIDTTVTDEDVDAELDRVKEQNVRLVAADDKAVEDGDQTIIDFEGFVDGEAFEGGKGEDYTLNIGSHTFIDNFEEQLIGSKVGDDVEVNVTFPENYQAEELAGKPALFKVKVKEIKVKEYPELDDDFAQDVSEFDTLAEYKEDIKKNLQEKKEADAKAEKESKVIEAIVNDSEMEIPEKMIDAQADRMMEEFAQNMAMQGLTFDQYLQFTGSTADQMKEQIKPQAKQRVETDLVLGAVIEAEKIEANDEEFDKELDTMAQQYQMEKEKIAELLSDDDKDNIKDTIAKRKAAEFVVAEAK